MSRKTRKLIWAVPLAAVFAVIGALAIFAAQPPGGAQAEHVTLPGAVTDLKAEVKGRSEIAISWKDPAGSTVDSYRIDTSDDTYVWMSKEMSTTNVTTDKDGVVTYTDTDKLAANDSRYYRVFAINAAGTGPSPLQDYVRADGIGNMTPGIPQNLTAKADSTDGTTVNLTWDAPTDTGNTDITLYCISVSRPAVTFAPVNDGNCAATSTATNAAGLATIITNLGTGQAGTFVIKAGDSSAKQSYEHKGLAETTRYRYRVTAVNSAGRSDQPSNIANVVTGKAKAGTTPTAPDAVRDLRAVRASNGSVTLYWNLPADKDATAENFTIFYEVATATSASLPAEDSTSWGTPTDANGDAGDPDEHSVGNVDKPGTTGHKVHYRVRVKAGSNDNPPAGSWSTFTLSPKAFDYDLTADNDQVLIPGPPQTGTANNRLLPTASANGTLDQITLTWGFIPVANNDHIQRPTGYEVDFVKSTDNPPNIGENLQAPDLEDQQHWGAMLPERRSGYGRSPMTHRGIDAGTEYIYRIFPYKDGVYGVPVVVNAATDPAVAPDTRLNLRVAAEGSTKLKLTWDEPRSDGGADVTGYLIQVANDVDDNRIRSTANNPQWVSIHDSSDYETTTVVLASDGDQDEWKIDDPDTREYVYKGLNPEDIRWFRVIALNSAATVPATDDSVDTPNAEAIDALGSAVPVWGQTAKAVAPMPPVGVLAETARNSNLTGAGNRGVLILWNASDDPTGDDVDGYVISRKVDIGDVEGKWDDDWGKIEEPDPRTYENDSSIPAANETRHYRVAAFNDSGGTGDWSNVATYPADTTHNHPPTKNGTIPAVTVKDGGPMQTATVDASLYFTDTDSGDKLTFTAVSDMPTYADASVTDNTVTITGMQPTMAGTTVTITVTATDTGMLTETQTIMVTVEAADTSLKAPTGVTATMVSTTDPATESVEVTWTNGLNAIGHLVFLFDANWDLATSADPNPATGQTDGTTVFSGVPAGTYTAVVVAYNAASEYDYDTATVTVTVGP